MTTAKNLTAFRLPDPPDREPDDMTSYRQLAATSIIAPLRHYLGDRDTTLVTGEQYLCRAVTQSLAGSRYPDLMIAFDVDMDAYLGSNGYVINDQGKPPDFVLEIASLKTGREDVTGKRNDYAGFGIPEYWRFDETPNGAWHGARLTGDRLVNGVYQPIPIERISAEILQGYSPVLNLLLRWENGELRWHDPATGQHIATFADAQARADQAEDRASRERAARRQAETRASQAEDRAGRAEDRAGRAEDRANQAETRADQERAARLQAEARAREMESRFGDIGNQ